MIFRISRQNAGWLNTILNECLNLYMHDALASEPMITVRPARPANLLLKSFKRLKTLIEESLLPSLCQREEYSPSLPKRGNTPLNPLFIEGKVPPLEKGDEGGFFRIHLREENVMKLRQTLASYLGHFNHADAYKLTRSLFERYRYLKDIFTVNNDNCLVPLYEPPFEPANLRGQYNWVMKQYHGSCIFFQVGKFCEFYGEQAESYGKFLGLSTADSPNTTGQAGRAGMTGMRCGFPVRYLKNFKPKALNAGLPYVVVGERGCYPSGLKKRIITEIYN